MTDRELATVLLEVTQLEQAARAHWQTAATRAEREAALLVVRQTTAVMHALKDWIVLRAAGLASTATKVGGRDGNGQARLGGMDDQH